MYKRTSNLQQVMKDSDIHLKCTINLSKLRGQKKKKKTAYSPNINLGLWIQNISVMFEWPTSFQNTCMSSTCSEVFSNVFLQAFLYQKGSQAHSVRIMFSQSNLITKTINCFKFSCNDSLAEVHIFKNLSSPDQLIIPRPKSHYSCLQSQPLLMVPVLFHVQPKLDFDCFSQDIF